MPAILGHHFKTSVQVFHLFKNVVFDTTDILQLIALFLIDEYLGFYCYCLLLQLEFQ